MPVSSGKFYYLQECGPWFDTFTLDETVTWTNLTLGSVIIPDALHLEAGAEPDKLIFHVMADSAYSSGHIYPAIASANYDAAYRPDGTQGTVTFPAYENAPLREFTVVRLMEGDGPMPVEESDTPRWVGIVTGATLDVGTETWTVEAIDLVRWRLECYVVKGLLWHETGVDFRYYPKMLPVFNAEGKRDCSISLITGNPYLLFDNAEQRDSTGALMVSYWRLGDIVNYLRKCWYALHEATNLTIIGVSGISRFTEWDEVTTATHPWLFTGVAASKNTVSDLTLGGMTVNEALDTVLALADGNWAPEHQADGKYKLEFWPKSGRGDFFLYRGDTGNQPGVEGTEPDLVGGTVSLDWSGVRSHNIVPGVIHAHEVTVAYDPLNLSADVHPRIITRGWSEADEDLYKIAKSEDGFDPNALDTKYPDVYSRFIFDMDYDWDAALYTAPGTTPSRRGKREFLDMVSMLDSLEITAKVWRWDTTSSTFKPQPSQVSLKFNKDGSFQVMGYDPTDDKLATSLASGDDRYPRYCEPRVIEDAFRPFAVTICVAGDERAWGENDTTPDSGYPASLEDCSTPVKMQNQSVKKVRHFLKPSGDYMVAAENGDLYGIPDIGLSGQAYVTDNRVELNEMATRRRGNTLYPKCTGTLKLRVFNWNLEPGLRLQALMAGGDPALPTVSVGGNVKRVSFIGLGQMGDETEQLLELGE